MLCQSCQKREATRHESVLKGDGSWSEVHVCDQCAEKGEVSILTPASLVQALIEGSTSLSAAKPGVAGRTCPRCGITYAEFRAKGRLGCPQDYEVFQPELTALIEKIHHGGLQHVGKSPASTENRSASERELIDLRRALAEAVTGERYEEAARLRDRIRIVEEGGEPPPPPAVGRAPSARAKGRSSGTSKGASKGRGKPRGGKK
jgi:protein arginine kinase activator